MANSITNAFVKLLAALLLFAFLLAAAVPADAREVPEWFAETMLDARDEAADAAKQGKRLMLYFWLEGCPYCERMTSVTFRDAAVLQRLKRGFVPVAINVRGDRDIAWTDGATLTEKALAAKLAVRGTPTIVFLDGKGEVVLRRVGYVAPAAFLRLLEELSTAPTAALRSASRR
jgi:thioredoxin-related protein